MTSGAAYVNIVTPLLANAYTAALRRQMVKHGLEPDDLDLELGGASNPYSPNPALGRLGLGEGCRRTSKLTSTGFSRSTATSPTAATTSPCPRGRSSQTRFFAWPSTTQR